MKKFLALCACFVMILSITACGEKETLSSSDSSSSSSSSSSPSSSSSSESLESSSSSESSQEPVQPDPEEPSSLPSSSSEDAFAGTWTDGGGVPYVSFENGIVTYLTDSGLDSSHDFPSGTSFSYQILNDNQIQLINDSQSYELVLNYSFDADGSLSVWDENGNGMNLYKK